MWNRNLSRETETCAQQEHCEHPRGFLEKNVRDFYKIFDYMMKINIKQLAINFN